MNEFGCRLIRKRNFFLQVLELKAEASKWEELIVLSVHAYIINVSI